MLKVTTTYSGPTDTRGTRIIAKLDGKQATVPYDYSGSALDNHATAAAKLVRRVFPDLTGDKVVAVEDRETGYRWTLDV